MILILYYSEHVESVVAEYKPYERATQKMLQRISEVQCGCYKWLGQCQTDSWTVSILSGEYHSFYWGFCDDMPWALTVLLVQ